MFFHFRYVEEHVQKTGVAIETQGFTVVTSGKKRESLTVISNFFLIAVPFVCTKFTCLIMSKGVSLNTVV